MYIQSIIRIPSNQKGEREVLSLTGQGMYISLKKPQIQGDTHEAIDDEVDISLRCLYFASLFHK